MSPGGATNTVSVVGSPFALDDDAAKPYQRLAVNGPLGDAVAVSLE